MRNLGTSLYKKKSPTARVGHYHSILTRTPAVVSPENFFSAPAVIFAEPILFAHLTPTPCSVAPAVIGPILRPATIKGWTDPS